MKKLFLYATIVSGALAAYLMYKHGRPVGEIASGVIKDPFGSLYNEMKQG